MSVKAKKHLGQHFLNDQSICRDIAESLKINDKYKNVIEIGPGMGALTKYLLENEKINLSLIDLDQESVDYLKVNIDLPDEKIMYGDFLKLNLQDIMGQDPFAVIGNFPYNISSQILFKVLDYKDQIPEVVGMFQKEVAERIAEPPGTKKYGILSVLLQTYYDIEYLFTVHEHVFTPPPKVKSGVIRLIRNDRVLDCSPKVLKQVVKLAFNQRRKTLRNSIKSILTDQSRQELDKYLGLRPEQISVDDFISITKVIEKDRANAPK